MITLTKTFRNEDGTITDSAVTLDDKGVGLAIVKLVVGVGLSTGCVIMLNKMLKNF